jgi:phospholipase A1
MKKLCTIAKIIMPAVMLVTILFAANVFAEQANPKRCDALKDDVERLRCYDEAAGRTEPVRNDERSGIYGEESSSKPIEGATQPTALSRRWELEPVTKNGVWIVQPYYPLFLLPVRYSDSPNNSPQSPNHPFDFEVPVNNYEAEFQISFKVKTAENLFGSYADLWFGYTQQSQWQVYTSSVSRPFRETNYMPELFLVIPTRYDLFGLRGRFIQLGLLHQSNGRANPLSRSWNRVYANFGFERGNFALYVRPWFRIREKIEDDDNPDIHRYMGYGDVTAIYKWGRQEFSLLGRYNTATSHGAAQGTWSFPIQGRLTGYVTVFTGYGETLIDYNWRQTTIGVGIELIQWL